jgi:hypothetical protein
MQHDRRGNSNDPVYPNGAQYRIELAKETTSQLIDPRLFANANKGLACKPPYRITYVWVKWAMGFVEIYAVERINMRVL